MPPPLIQLQATLAVDARAELAESPVWDPGRNELLWVDGDAGVLHGHCPASGESRSLPVGQPIGAIALWNASHLVAAVRDGFAAIDTASSDLELLAAVGPDTPAHLMNDGACDVAGRFWAGTIAAGGVTGAATLYRLDPDLSVARMLENITISNGIDWLPDNSRMFYVDSPTSRIDVFDFDVTSGAITNRRLFVAICPEDGVPDGLTVDAEGGVWVALWGGSQVRRYDGAGHLDAVVQVPARQVTSCAFGGSDLGDLYITTAAWQLDPADLRRQPLAGGVFRVRPGVSGRTPNRFGHL